MFEFVERNFSPERTVYGIDEAGRGPFAGPLSIALVQFSDDQLNLIESGSYLKGLGDSKKLSQKTRHFLQQILEKDCLFKHIFISHSSIDRFGLSYCTYRGIMKLIRDLPLESSVFLIDGNYKFERFMQEGQKFQYQSIIGGDARIPSIAAASIIAKERRDVYMRALSKSYPEYGFSTNMGYGTKHHREAISKYGISKYHRKSFLKEFLNSPMLFN